MRTFWLAFTLSFFAIPTFSQDTDILQYLDSKKGAIIYEVPISFKYSDIERREVDYTKFKKKKIGDKHLQIIGLAHLIPNFDYDSYIIDYGGKKYFIHRDNVLDNSYLNEHNLLLKYRYDSLKRKESELIEYHKVTYDVIFEKIDYLKRIKRKQIDDLNNNYDSLELLFIKEAKQLEEQKYIEKDLKYAKWVETLPNSVQKYASQFAIIREYFDVGYLDNCSYAFVFANRTNKTINYIYWSIRIKNTAGDVISCNVRHISTISGRFVGPCPPYSIGEGSWANLMYNGEANTCELNSIRIVYKDGSTLSLDKNVLKYLLLPKGMINRFDVYLKSPYTNADEKLLQQDKTFLWSEREHFKESMKKKTIKLHDERRDLGYVEMGMRKGGLDNPDAILLIKDLNKNDKDFLMPTFNEFVRSSSEIKGVRSELARFLIVL